jgi:hypothetical protein
MSSSRHPIARRLDRWVDGPTKLLATVMGLPLVDGIFAAIVLAGGLSSLAGIVQVGLLVFGGSATVAVVFSEFDDSRWESASRVLLVGVPMIVLAGLEAALAPTIGSVLSLAIFERFAAVVVLAIAAKTASARIGEYLPKPSAIVVLGFLASVRPGTFEFALHLDPVLVARAVGAGTVGVCFALGVVIMRPYLTDILDVDRFRFGSAVALGMLAVSLFRPELGFAPLAVLAVTTVLAFDPDGSARHREQPISTDGGQGVDGESESALDTDNDDVSHRPPYL